MRDLVVQVYELLIGKLVEGLDRLSLSVLSTLLVQLILVLLAKQDKNKNTQLDSKLDSTAEKLTGTIGSEFERNRREMQSSQQAMRLETAKSLGEMSEKIEKLRLDNTEYQGRTEKALSESLNSIRLNNIEQNEKQGKVLAEAVDRMRESNEKRD